MIRLGALAYLSVHTSARSAGIFSSTFTAGSLLECHSSEARGINTFGSSGSSAAAFGRNLLSHLSKMMAWVFKTNSFVNMGLTRVGYMTRRLAVPVMVARCLCFATCSRSYRQQREHGQNYSRNAAFDAEQYS